MLEKKIEIKGLNPAELYGVKNEKLKHIKSHFPKLKIVARGNILTIAGDEEVMDELKGLEVQREETNSKLSDYLKELGY